MERIAEVATDRGDAMPKTFSTSVVICAYTEERWDALIDAIESVQQQTVPPGELIVVIDHNPQLLERIRAHFPIVCVLENVGSPGHSGSMNTGARVAKGTILAFLDDDAAADPDWLAFLLRAYDDPNVLGVGGFIEPVWLTSRPRWFPEEFLWIVGCTYRGVPTKTAPIRNPIGANLSIRREEYAEIGGVRDAFARVGTRPFSCNETDLCIRAVQKWPGRFFLHEPRARVRHRVPAVRARFAYFRSHCYDEGAAKALLSRLVGNKDGLKSERQYTYQILPSGVIRGLLDFVVHRDLAGLGRAGAIVVGFTMAAAGYISGKIPRYQGPPAPEKQDDEPRV